MAGFDPYWKWLGIPPKDQPSHHYRLLGIQLFESDSDVIGNAADRQMGHVRTFQSGRYSALSQQILNELAAARVCLLDPAKKAAYDAQLRRQMSSAGPPQAPPIPSPQSPEPPVSLREPAAAAAVATTATEELPGPAIVAPLPPLVGHYATRRKKPAVALSTIAVLAVPVLGGLALLAWQLGNQPGPAAPPPPESKRSGAPPNDAKGNGKSIGHVPSPTDNGHELPGPDSGGVGSRGRTNPPSQVTGTGGTGTPKSNPPKPEPGKFIGSPGDTVPDTTAVDNLPPIGPPKPPPEPISPKPPGPVKRIAVPDKSSLDLAEAQVRNGPLKPLFDVAATKEGKADVAGRLIAEARKLDADPATQYVMLRIARDMASEAADFEVAMTAVESLDKTFDVDAAAMTAAMLKPLGELPSLASRRRAIVSSPALLRHLGATEASQAAVEAALAWLAKHQNVDGSWNFNHVSPKCKDQCPNPGVLTQAPNAATALALMPFLGAGHGQDEDEYQKVVARGLNFLSKNRKEIRTTWGPSASFHDRMAPTAPSHALATIALCESVEGRGDAKLRASAQHAVNMILATQNDDGGWSADPQLVYPELRNPDVSNMQTTYWSIVALKVAQWQGIQVPADVLGRAGAFLDAMAVGNNQVYRATARPGPIDNDATAMAFLSRLYLGWPRTQPQLVTYATQTARSGPATTGKFSLNYVQDQVLRDCSGPGWPTWNTALRDHLVATQGSSGHAAGSWFLDSPDGANKMGGRLFCTALAALTLEVYYRYPPLE